MKFPNLNQFKNKINQILIYFSHYGYLSFLYHLKPKYRIETSRYLRDQSLLCVQIVIQKHQIQTIDSVFAQDVPESNFRIIVQKTLRCFT